VTKLTAHISKGVRCVSVVIWAWCFFFANDCQAQAQQYFTDWIKTSPSAGAGSRGIAIKTTADGNIVVGGSTDNELGETDYLAIKYNAAGDEIWKTAHGSERTNNVLTDVTLDPAGNILLTGSSDTVKLDAFGNHLWSAPFNGRSIAANARYAYVASSNSPSSSAIQLGNETPAPVDMILDCDPGQDPDDMSDLAIVNNLMSRGEVNLLAIMGAHKGHAVAVSIDVMKTFYGHPTIPYGVAQVGPVIVEGYGFYMAERYGTTIRYDAPLPDSIALYRSILAARPDNSVTIVFSGQLRNLYALWNSGPDGVSPLYGPALLAKKVRQIVIVAGFFPDSLGVPEYNLMTDAEAAQVLNLITDNVSMTYVGIELGDPISIPIKGVGVMDAANPVRYAHEIWRVPSRPSWAGLGLLVAARGYSWNGNTYFRSVPGHAFVREIGSNGFVEEGNANHRYLRKTQPDERYIEVLDDLLLVPPPTAPQPAAGDQTGQEIWTRPFNVNASDEASFVRVNQFGEVFVGGIESAVGETTSARFASARFALAKYGEAGTVRWRTPATNTVTADRSATILQNMFVAGQSIWLFGQYGQASTVFKFSTSGTQLWHYNFPDGSSARQMVVDATGTAYVANMVTDKIVVTSISNDGSVLHEAVYQPQAGERVDLEAAALDGSRAVYFAGGLRSSEKSEVFLIRFNQDLSQSLITTYRSQYGGDARAKAIAIQNSADVYLTGHMPNSKGAAELFTLKLVPAFQIQKLDSGRIRLTYSVATNETLNLEASHDFSQWEPIATLSAQGRGFIQFEDTNVLDMPARFYRTRKKSAP
jgi:hypothetical protein